MARNSTGTLVVVVPVIGESSYYFSTQDDLAAVSQIPATSGPTLYLPSGVNPGDGPAAGDSYAWGDVDGSCSSGNPIIIAAPSGTTIRGGSSVTFTNAYVSGRVVFDDSTDSWSIQSLTEPTPVSGVVWSDDLRTSTDDDQWVSGLSGANGTGGVITVGDGVHSVSLVQSGGAVGLTLESAGPLLLKGAGQPNFALNVQATATQLIGGTSTASSIILENSLIGIVPGTASAIATITPLGWEWAQSSVTLAATGTTTLTSSQQATPLLVMGAVTLTGHATLALDGVAGGFFLDFSAVNLNGQTLTVTNGAGSAVVSSSTLVVASCRTTNLVSLSSSSPPGIPDPGGEENGDILFYQGGEWNLRHIGTAGYVLTSFEGSPTWEPAAQQPAIVPNIAALGSLAAGGFASGTPVIVQSVNALWTYEPASTLATDGITVVAATGGGNWLRAVSLAPEQYIAQTVWWVDAQNVETTSSDENTGLTAATALRTKAEISRRWGTWSPTLNAIAVTVNYLSPDTTSADPGMFAPVFVDGATLTECGAVGGVSGGFPAHSFLGTLNVVTPNSPTTNTILQTTVNTASGALAVGMLLVNTTRGNSIAWVASISEGIATLSQPMTPYAGSGVYESSAVNTWAAGDGIAGYVPLAINLAKVAGTATDLGNDFDTASHIVWRIAVFDPLAGDDDFDALFVDMAAAPTFAECQVNRDTQIYGPVNVGAMFGNCAQMGGGVVTAGLGINGGLLIYAGLIQAALEASGVTFEWNALITATTAQAANVIMTGVEAGLALLSGSTLTLAGACTISTGQIYGNGVLNVTGTVTYAGLAETRFPVGIAGGGGITLNGVGFGYSNSTVGGGGGLTTTHGGITLTSLHLDAGAGSAGFGGYAYGGGAVLSAAGVQP